MPEISLCSTGALAALPLKRLINCKRFLRERGCWLHGLHKTNDQHFFPFLR